MYVGSTSSYQVHELVARGRSGETFRAVDASGRVVALKVHDRADDGRAELARLSTIDHSGVVTSIDHGTRQDGKVWIVLPWLEGRTLAALLAAEAPLEIERGLRIIEHVAEALDAVHAADIVHGDLSPQNVMVGPDDRITLIDFSASAITDGDLEGTADLELTVTPRYAAPEVAAGARPSPASDRYALTTIAYELLTGAFPFPEVATPLAVLAHHASSAPIAPSEHRPDLAPGAERALLRGLAKEPTQRHLSAVAFASALTDDVAPLSQRSHRRRAIAGAIVAVLLAAGAWGLVAPGRAADDEPEGDWDAGRAARLSCNSLTEPGFEAQELPEHFYGGDPTNTVDRSDESGVGGSAALVVGGPSAFGLFGEVVPVVPDREHIFSVWLRRQDGIDTSAIYIDYLNRDFVQITAARDSLGEGDSIGEDTGRRFEVRATAPSDAAYAVPTIFKDGSPGTLIVDEAVFGLSGACPDLTS